MKVYDEMSEYYDLIYGDLADAEFYLTEAKNARGKVLEIGCGTGRILLRLMEHGVDVLGIDSSEKMIALLKEKAKEKGLSPEVSVANMLDFSLPDRFQLIILPYRTFLHLKTKEERKKALLNFKKHLEEGGRLILHIYNPCSEDFEMTGEYHHFETEELVSDGKAYQIEWHLHYEPVGRMAHYKVVLVIDGKRIEYQMDIAFVEMKEMRELLKEAGYKNVRSYCGFDYLPFNENCSEVLWVAEV